MADDVTEWSSTAANNTSLGSTTLLENLMKPSDVNNAFRELMAQVAAGIAAGDLGGVPTGRQVATQHSLTGGGDLTADRTLSLVNDSATPGNNKVYGTDGSGTRGWKDDPAGTGDVVGPASATDNAIALFDGTTGKLLQDSAVAISTDDTLSSDSDSKVPTEQAVKAYVDNNAGGQPIQTSSTLPVGWSGWVYMNISNNVVSHGESVSGTSISSLRGPPTNSTSQIFGGTSVPTARTATTQTGTWTNFTGQDQGNAGGTQGATAWMTRTA